MLRTGRGAGRAAARGSKARAGSAGRADDAPRTPTIATSSDREQGRPMASQKQRDASRKNAQKSTGPKTEEGKARAARNGTTHGLTANPENDPTDAGRAAYQGRLAEWIADIRPVGA